MLGFRVKILGCFLFVIYYTYLTGGDTRSLYYPEGYNLFKALLNNPGAWSYLFRSSIDFDNLRIFSEAGLGYLAGSENYLIVKITAIICFFSFGQFLIINLIFAAIAYSGLWKLFMFFYERKPELQTGFALSILFFPSVVFWSAGLMKDSLCIAAMGWLSYSLWKLTFGNKILKNLLMVIISIYLLAVLKTYILLAYAPFLVLYLFLDKLKVIKSAFLKVLVTASAFVVIAAAFSATYSSFGDEMGRYSVENLSSSMSTMSGNFQYMNDKGLAESDFNLGAEYDGTLPGLVKVAPFAIAATFFRPFIWEAHKISQLMAAVESLILIFFTLKLLLLAGPIRMIRFVLTDSMILFCFSFAIIFGLFVGTITLNFGTLVRYKIPCLPFYAIALFLINQKIEERRAKKDEEETIPVEELTTL